MALTRTLANTLVNLCSPAAACPHPLQRWCVPKPAPKHSVLSSYCSRCSLNITSVRNSKSKVGKGGVTKNREGKMETCFLWWGIYITCTHVDCLTRYLSRDPQNVTIGIQNLFVFILYLCCLHLVLCYKYCYASSYIWLIFFSLWGHCTSAYTRCCFFTRFASACNYFQLF